VPVWRARNRGVKAANWKRLWLRRDRKRINLNPCLEHRLYPLCLPRPRDCRQQARQPNLPNRIPREKNLKVKTRKKRLEFHLSRQKGR
jgi:hypothetical protein